MYLAEDPHLEKNDFSLFEFWLRRSKASTCAEAGEVEAGLPYLALIAWLYHGIESTSCQAERNFSAVSFLIGSLRSSISPGKLEPLVIFLRLKKLFIPEVKTLHDAIEANKAAAARCKEKVAQVEGAMANTALVVNLLMCSFVVYSMCVCVCVFIKLHITTQSGPVILVILCHSH